MFQTLHTHCISLSIAGIRLFVECGLQPSPGLDLFQQLRLCPAVLQRGPEMPGALPAAGLLPADKAGVLKMPEQVHHPDIIDVLVHNHPPFQAEDAPMGRGVLHPISSEILDFQKAIIPRLYSTRLPQAAGRQRTDCAGAHHGNLTPPRIAPSCPTACGRDWTGVSLSDCWRSRAG